MREDAGVTPYLYSAVLLLSMIDHEGMEPCSVCEIKYHISDPQTYEVQQDKIICKTCFYKIIKGTSWHNKIEPKIVFSYTKVAIPHALKWKVWKRDGFMCLNCWSTDNLSVDHIHPESYGGTLEMENLQTLCRSCNSSKGNRV